MVATQHTQSLTDFRQNATKTLDRLHQTGEAEILTVNGEARAVLLSPSAYDDLARDALLVRDTAGIRQSITELREGKGRDVDVVFDELRAELTALKKDRKRAKGK